MKFIISVGLMVFGLTLSYAQATFSVQGKVIDFHNKVPLSSAVIKIGSYTVISDAKGNFNFQQIKRGSYTLIANHPDCDAFTQKIDVSGNLNIILNLEHHIGEIETVTIHGNHRNNGSMVMKTLDKAQIEKNATDNLGNLLSKISGVSALKTGNNIA
mgnify:FL=1